MKNLITYEKASEAYKKGAELTEKPEEDNEKSYEKIREKLLFDLKRHPDRGGDNKSAAEINRAYDECIKGSEADCDELITMYKKAKIVKEREV